MSLTRLQARLLVALLDFAQADRPANVKGLADHLDVRLGVVASELSVLDRLGLVHAGRIRLSFLGLAVAARARVQLQTQLKAVSLAA